MSSEATNIKAGIAAGDQRHMNLALEIGLLLLLSLIWGSSFTLIKIAAETVPPLTMTAARVTIAALLLVLFMKMRGLSLPRTGAIWAAFFVQGLLQSALPFTLISWGEQHIASGLAGVLNATPPMFVLLIAMTTRYGGRRITMQKATGVVIGLAGVVITVGFQSLGHTAAPLAQAAVLGASLCYALAPMWGQRFAGLPAIVTAAGAMSCAAIMMLPAAIIIERPWTLAPTPEVTVAVLVLAVLCTAIAMIIHFRLVQTLGPLGTTSGSYLRAGFAVTLGILFLGESFTWSILIGMTLIILGVIAVTAPLRWPFSRGGYVMEALAAMVHTQEDWCEQGWRFRLYLGLSDSESAIDASELLTLMKYLIRSRVVSIINPAEFTRQSFAIGSALAPGCVRIQICWWTLGGELHREAILGWPGEKCWERLPPWEIGNAAETAILTREAAGFVQGLRN